MNRHAPIPKKVATMKNKKELLLEVEELRMRLEGAEETLRAIRQSENLTERNHAEEALRESEERFRKIFEEGPLGMAIVGLDDRFVKVNAMLCQMLEYTEEELAALTVTDITHPLDVSSDIQFAEKLLRGEIPAYQMEKRYLKKDEGIIWVNLTRSLIRDQREAPLYFLTMMEDITKRKHSERALQQRTAELEAANKELEAFSYSVSHDLRAPLRGIDGFSLALLEDYADKLDEKGRDYLSRVRGNAQKMSELIDAMLSLSRLTRGEIRRRTVDLSKVAKNIASELQKRQPERQVEFVIAEGVTADGDPEMLRVVLENLLGNAWKFTGKRSIARVEFGVTLKDGKPVYFVRDDGAGFDMEYVDKLFGAFQRLHRTTEFPGIGIGLATIQRIIHRHGGLTWAEGEVEKGATFYFTLLR